MIMVAGSLMTEHERPVDRVADNVEAELLCPHQDSDVASVDGDRTLACSAIRDELYLLVLSYRQRGLGARLGIRASAGWRELTLRGERICEPRGMVGVTTELGKVALAGSVRTSISLDEGEDLLVGVSRKVPRLTTIVRLRVTEDGRSACHGPADGLSRYQLAGACTNVCLCDPTPTRRLTEDTSR